MDDFYAKESKFEAAVISSWIYREENISKSRNYF